MALPINVEELLAKNKVESNRIEFKAGWNPVPIYHSICAFANDIDNLGGGYILIGVEESKGVAKRPVKGIPEESLDRIQREILKYNQLLEPRYAPRISVEEVDGRSVLVLWVTAGHNRPYSVPVDVTAKLKKSVFYVRYGTSSIEAKGEFLDQLRDMANRVPFDDRGNEKIKIDDLSSYLIKEYLQRVNSRLVTDNFASNLESILEQMDLLDGPKESRLVKNVAAMMFCENPQKFFPTTRVEIVVFPEGREQNPDNFIEVPPIVGPVPRMIYDALNYIKVNVIKEMVKKQPNDEHSIRVFNYPYQAVEEAVVNALYHRDYMEREPVEITIEPERISILSYSGPDRSISMESIREANSLRSRRYRNRRLGEFLKELELTEGRATGIPTIQKQLRENGSAKARIETDEGRSYFMIDIPCHPSFTKTSHDEDVFAADASLFLERMSKLCPSYVQVVSKLPVENIIQCLLRCKDPISARELLQGLEDISLKQLRRKYLDCLIGMSAVNMTNPEKPTSRSQKYVISELGKKLISK